MAPATTTSTSIAFAQPVPQRLPELARAVSDRHFGVGADGLVLICPSENRSTPRCGCSTPTARRLRCAATRSVAWRSICTITTSPAGTPSGSNRRRSRVHPRTCPLSDGLVERVRVDMGEPVLEAERIPTTLTGNPVVDASLALSDQDSPGRKLQVTCVSMGNPHCVAFVEEITDELVHSVGPRIELDAHFPNRVNVEFVEVFNRKQLRQRTWERGSGETLACGTGASAVCVAGVLTGRAERRVTIQLLGGDLELEWNEADNHVYKTGPAVEVFSGEWPW